MAEPLFDPLGHGLKAIPGLVQAVHLSLSYLDPERRALLRERVLLTGGVSQLPDLAERLERDLRGLVPTPESGERVESIMYSEIPRCFRDWREEPQRPGLLGGSIYAKVRGTERGKAEMAVNGILASRRRCTMNWILMPGISLLNT